MASLTCVCSLPHSLAPTDSRAEYKGSPVCGACSGAFEPRSSSSGSQLRQGPFTSQRPRVLRAGAPHSGGTPCPRTQPRALGAAVRRAFRVPWVTEAELFPGQPSCSAVSSCPRFPSCPVSTCGCPGCTAQGTPTRGASREVLSCPHVTSWWASILAIYMRGDWVSGRRLVLLTEQLPPGASDPSSQPGACFRDTRGLARGRRWKARGDAEAAAGLVPWLSGLHS